MYIREALKPYYSEIAASDEPMVELGKAIYSISENYIGVIVKPISNVRISLIGGIQINVSQPCGDFFEPRMFKVIEEGKPTRDLYHIFKEEPHYDD